MFKIFTALAMACALSGCVAAAVVGTAVSVTGDVVEGAVNTTGAVVDAVIPDGDRKKDKDDDD